MKLVFPLRRWMTGTQASEVMCLMLDASVIASVLWDLLKLLCLGGVWGLGTGKPLVNKAAMFLNLQSMHACVLYIYVEQALASFIKENFCMIYFSPLFY